MNAILACDDVGGIGLNGSMPWPMLDGDLTRFKKLTLNTTVVMGRGTWESTDMPTPLPHRLNIVITGNRDLIDPQVAEVWTFEALLMNIHTDTLPKSSWLIGGAGLFRSAIDANIIDQLLLTRVPGNYACDTHIDLVQLEDAFKLTCTEEFSDHTLQTWKSTK